MESLTGVAAMGVGPTVLGLGALGLLFMVPLIIRLVRLAMTSSVKGASLRAAASEPVEEETFDADAALARYLARKAEGGEEVPSVADPAGTPAAARPVFGRKVA